MRTLIGTGALVMSLGLASCKKDAPPESHAQKGYRLLLQDPAAAYDAFGKAKDQQAPHVLLGRGLALEGLKRYEKAEQDLVQASAKLDEPAAWLPLARVSLVLGKTKEARRLVDKTVKALPQDLAAVLLNVCLANTPARAEAALAHLDQWLELGRQQKPRPAKIPGEFHVARVILLQQLKMEALLDSAKEQAKRVKLSDRRAALALVELAAKGGRRDLATALLRKINTEAPSAKTRFQVAQLAHSLGDHQLVERILQTLPGDDAEHLRLRGKHDFVTAKTRAPVTLRRALAQTDDSSTRSRLWSMLVRALLQNGNQKEARPEAEKMLAEFPKGEGALLLARMDITDDEPQAALQRLAPMLATSAVPVATREVAALAHVKLGQSDQARRLLDSLLKEVPAHERAARLRISLELEAGKHKEANRVAEGLLAGNPNNVELRLIAAKAARKGGGQDAAIRSLRKSVNALKTEGRLWMALVKELDQGDAGAEALAVLEQAHQQLPLDHRVAAALASRLAKTGQGQRAATLYEQLLSKAKDDPVALNNLAMLYAEELNNPARGVELAEQAYSLAKAPAIADTLGWALFKRGAAGDLQRAQQLLESAQSSLTGPSAMYRLGAVWLAAGEVEKGRALLRRALEQTEFPEADQARHLLNAKP